MLVTQQAVLRRFWYAVMPMARLDQGPQPFRLLGEDIVLWKAADGTPAAVRDRRWLRPALAGNLAVFVVAQVALMFFGAQEVLANPAVEAAMKGEMSTGMGLALLGVGIPTGLSTIGAGLAVGPIGAASLAAVAEKPSGPSRGISTKRP